MSAKPDRTIRPGPVPIRRYCRDLWEHRDLLLVLAGRDLKLRYRQTALGVTWVVLQPLLAAGILSFVFGRVAQLPTEGVPYFVFSFVGLMGWNVFNTTLTRSGSSLIASSSLVAKIYFPRLILPMSSVFGALVDFSVSVLVVVCIFMAEGTWPDGRVLFVPVWLGLLIMLALGLGFILAGAAVRYRDVPFILPVLLQFLLYASPVAYSALAVPSRFETVFHLNPVATLLEGFRWSLLDTTPPRAAYVVYCILVSIVLFVCGALVLEKREQRFADVV